MDISYDSLAVPVLAALAGAALATVIAIALRGKLRSLTTAVAVTAVTAVAVVLVGVGYAAFERMAAAQQSAAQRALDARRADLMRQASEPGAVLGCVDGLVGEAVQKACRAAVFATPQTVAAATLHAAEQLDLLRDGLAYARRFDPGYAERLAGLRRAVENDAYGFYSHVLAVRDGCTAQRCAAFSLLSDDKMIRAHLREQTYAHQIAEDSPRWRSGAATVAAKAAASPPPAASKPPTASNANKPAPPSSPPLSVAAATASPVKTAAPVKSASAAKTALADTSGTHVPLSLQWPPTDTSELIAPHVVVPPVASVLPNLEYPSSASIPPVSIMAPEPRPKTASSEPSAKSVPLPRHAPRSQAQ